MWPDGTLGGSWTGTEVGWQAVTVQSDGGCSGSDSTWVSSLLPETVVLPDVPALCAGQDSLLAWPEGATGWTVNGTPMPDGWVATSGESVVAASDVATGCPFEASVNIALIDPDPAQLPAATALCAGQSVPLELTMDAASTVLWSPSTGLDDAEVAQPTASPATTTTYTASVTDVCGAVTALDVVVTVLEEPSPDLPDSVVLCGSELLQLDVVPLPGVVDPLWSDGTLGWSWEGNDPGWIGVVVTVLPGCAGSDSTWVEIESVQAPSVQADALCPGEFAFVPFPDGWVDWTLDGVPQSQGGLTVTEPGVYFAEAVSATSGCPVSVSIAVPSGALPQMGLSERVEFCSDQVVFLETGVPDPVLWNDGFSGPSRQVLDAGTYVATHTTDCGSVSIRCPSWRCPAVVWCSLPVPLRRTGT